MAIIFSKGNKILLSFVGIFLFVIIVLVSFILGVTYSSNQNKTTTVTSQIVFDKINSQSFLLTKTAFIDQKTQIKINQGSDWSNFFWGQTIDANALMKVDIGCDLSKLNTDKIKVDTVNKTIIIELPKATVSNITNASDIEIKSTSGILKFIFDNNPNSDFNKALIQLKNDSKTSVENNLELLNLAQQDTEKILKSLFSETGYKLIVEFN